MPTEKTAAAFLVDSEGQETLSEREQKTVRRYLDAPDGPARDAIEWLLKAASETPGLDDKEVLGQSLWHYTNTHDHTLAVGVLASVRGTGQIEDLDEKETEILQDTLAAVRVGGWFPEWLSLQVSAIAAGEGFPGDRHPTPLQTAASLALCIQEHEEEMENARQFAQRRPDLIVRATIEPTQEPQEAQTTQPITKRPAKAQTARKPRKKASRAR